MKMKMKMTMSEETVKRVVRGVEWGNTAIQAYRLVRKRNLKNSVEMSAAVLSLITTYL